MKKTVFGFICTLTTVFFCHCPAYGLLGDTVGVGLKASAMGEAFVAVADNYSATYYNPAGLGQITDELIMTVDWIYQAPKFKVTKLSTGEDLKFVDTNGVEVWNPVKAGSGDNLDDIDHNRPTIGITANMNEICSALNIPINLTIGVIMMIPNNMNQILILNDFVPDIPKLTRFGDPDEQLFIAFGLGAEIVKDLMFAGISAKIGIYGDGTVHNSDAGVILQGNQPQMPIESQAMVFQMQVDWRILGDLNPIVGILLTPFNKKLKIGATYRAETMFSIGPCPVIMNLGSDSSEQAALIPWNALVEYFIGYSPEEWSMGIAYEIGRLVLSAGVELQRWSEFPYTKIYDNQYFNLDWDLTGYLPSDPDFDDVLNTSIGMEYKHNHALTILAGYRHMPTPVPDQSGRVTNYLDMDKNAFSLGCTYLIYKNRIRIGAMFEYMVCENYKVYKDDVRGFAWWFQESFQVKGDVLTMGLSTEINF